jgi:TetR/AcrR family transcriptional repressor of bet genes
MNNHSVVDKITARFYAWANALFAIQGIRVSQLETKLRTKPRTASKEQRKEQLIKATIRSIAKNGLSVTTMSTVAKEAGLSQGIINLHFQSKDRLLEETLRFVVDEYRRAWFGALEKGGDTAVEKLTALVKVDFEKRICQRNKLAVWFAFWGESRSRPTYRQICAQWDLEYREVLTDLCEEIIQDGGYSSRAEFVAYGLSAMSEGLWLDLLLNSAEMTAELAYEVSISYLRDIFPMHFGH